MSQQPPRTRSRVIVAPPNTPEELEAATAEYRRLKKTAAGRIGCEQVIDAPLPELARFVVELDTADRQEFLRELVARLPADALASLADALRARLGDPAA
jgi:hypothetical protein